MKNFMTIMATMLLVACSGDQSDNTAAEVKILGKNQPDMLTYIPAESPVLITSGIYPEQYPANYIDVMQSNMDGVVKYLEVLIKQATDQSKKYAAVKDALDENNASPSETTTTEDPEQKKIMAFVDKWLIDENLNKVGFKVGETQLAVYLVDLIPVLRMKLSKGQQVEAMLTEMQQEFELPMVTTDVNGTKVREVVADQMTLLLALQDDYMVITGAPTVIKDQLFNQLLGLDKPSQSLADDPSVVTEIKQAHGFTTDDLMLVDFKALADYFINPSKHNSKLVNYLQIDDNMLSAACKDEISAMFDKAPRMVAGNKTLTGDTIHGALVWEMNQTLAVDMAKMTGRIPQGNDDAAMAFGMSFDLKGAKDIASKYVDQLINDPYQCEHLAPLNQQAQDMQAKLSQPIPPFVGNFKGFNFSLDDLELNLANADLANPNPNEIIESLKTQMYFALDETQALLGMAQMMVPQLQGIEIDTDGSLITLADKVPMLSGKDIPLDISELYAAISTDTIGLSMGHEGGGELSDKVKQEGQAVLMSFSANVDGYKKILEQIFSMAEMPDMPEQVKNELAIQKDLTLSMLYWKTQKMTLSFTDKGFVTDFNIKY
ncbi:hypothetical protein [Marinicella litoralis]|uniref:DUF3352 domain-containing protein n=1 Tax=Marinicella litoralis TaxID=644220 RepID=A0A4R6XTP3_9GAMM|nr:hypothetical protein [Marinicella litoralis]TDR23332.1 hypothetical protein C8D91_0192 [Marinicella litoralis]